MVASPAPESHAVAECTSCAFRPKGGGHSSVVPSSTPVCTTSCRLAMNRVSSLWLSTAFSSSTLTFQSKEAHRV